ncbi:MAG: 4-hydroxy-tetrahydrodipicolinate reductase [Candidatus Aenigmarchaeota archaeon]|nr:4-hydroxy-tetrahydrodipicolinate reductase [Candidatus Aenigmarchaeota archaeon]
MKIAIIGYGKMGHEIERLAKTKGIEVAAVIDPTDSSAAFKEINKEALSQADVVIDFSVPDAVAENVRRVSSLGKNMVVGTTGWYNSLNDVKDLVKKSNIGFIYSPNFSIGVNLFFRIVDESSKLVNKISDYDVFVYEGHHNQKADSPSGTARALGDIILRNVKRKKRLVFDKLDRKILPEELHVASFRAGFIPGTHVVGFDSEADTIELKHTARSRAGFALGALLAAQWLKGKTGFFTMDDFISDFFK